MKTPPAWFVSALHILDPLLSVRWGDVIGQWVIERKAVIPQSEIDFLKKRLERTRRMVTHPGEMNEQSLMSARRTYVGVSEEYTSARNGKRVILYTPDLNQSVYDQLVASDMQRYGGYARYLDAVEVAEERREREQQRVTDNKVHAANLETYDMLNFMWRKKENMLLNGERDMRYILHGKRTTRESEPLIKLTDF